MHNEQFAMSTVPAAEISRKYQHIPSEDDTTLDSSTTAMSDTSTPRDDTSMPLLHLTPRIVIKKAPDSIRTYSYPQLSPNDETIPVPGEFNEQTTRRMEWIMQMSMDALLFTLQPEQRKLIECTTDLRQLIVPLFQTWETFRSLDGQGNKTRKIAKSVYDKMKTTVTNNEFFERFWARKLITEKDEAAWERFKSVVTISLDQASAVDNILNSMNMCKVSVPGSVVDNRLWPLRELFSG